MNSFLNYLRKRLKIVRQGAQMDSNLHKFLHNTTSCRGKRLEYRKANQPYVLSQQERSERFNKLLSHIRRQFSNSQNEKKLSKNTVHHKESGQAEMLAIVNLFCFPKVRIKLVAETQN